MLRYLLVLAAPLAGLLAPSSVAAQTSCSAITDPARCLAVIREAGRHFRLLPLEAHEERGDQIRRVLTFTRGHNGRLAISFIRSPGEGPKIVVTLAPSRVGDDAAAMEAPLSGPDWEQVIERSEHFDRSLVPQPNSLLVCGDGAPLVVEASDPLRPGAYDKPEGRRRAEHSCDKGLADAFAGWAAEFALERFPACAPLRIRGLQALILADCARFSGDRVAAAQAYERAFYFRELEDGARSAEFSRLFSTGARLSWAGESVPGHAAEAWLRRARGDVGGSYFHESAYGETAYRVRVRGFLERASGSESDPRYSAAPVEMIWEGRDGDFRITQVRVGAFELASTIPCPLPWRASRRGRNPCTPF